MAGLASHKIPIVMVSDLFAITQGKQSAQSRSEEEQGCGFRDCTVNGTRDTTARYIESSHRVDFVVAVMLER